MTKFIEIELGKLGKTLTGKTPLAENVEDFGSEYLFITPSDSLDKKFVTQTERKLSQVGLDRLKSKALPSHSILVSCIGSAMGKVAMNRTICVTNQQFNCLIPNAETYSADFIYYALKNSYKMLRRAAAGSTALPILNKTDFDLLPLRVAEKKADQVKIARVLSSLDAKIELNSQINAELEAMTKLLYDYWFVQFDFPMTAAQAASLGRPALEGKPYKSSGGKMVHDATLNRLVPSGWTPETLGNVVASVSTGLNPRQHFELGRGQNYYVTIKSIEHGKLLLDAKCDRVDDDALLRINQRSDLRSGDILFTSIEPVGRLYLVRERPTNWNINESLFSIRPKDGQATSAYLYYLLSSQHCRGYCKKVSTGSIHKGIRIAALRDYNFPKPDDKLIHAFTEYCDPILKQIHILDCQNQELIQLRDWLLPMLMNGQVTVGA